MPNTVTAEPRPTRLEVGLAHARTPLVVPLVWLPVVCWAWIVVLARDMKGPMTGASTWMMAPHFDATHLFLLWVMWAVMMTGMMLPSASPMLLLYGAAVRAGSRRDADAHAARQITALAAGYLSIWAIFSLFATAAQRILSDGMIVSPMMTITRPAVAAALLVVAGLYQLTPLKMTCLRKCQTPLGFLMNHWREGIAGAFRMGAEHGAYCLGCCWALMLLLFVGGVMNLAVIAALTLFVAFEKLGLFGVNGARLSGGLLIVSGIWMAVRS